MTPTPLVAFLGAGVSSPALAGAEPRPLLHPFSLELHERRVALIGSNGQGKTMLLRLAAGLTSPSVGSVEVLGESWQQPRNGLQRRVGMMFADTAAQLIMPTVIEDVELSYRPAKLKARERRAAATQQLEALNIEHLAQRSVYELSSGERALVALAGLRAVQPELLLADEPTAALDLVNSDRVAAALFEGDAALVLATHDLELAARCERVLWVHAGRLVADGAAESVISAYLDAAKGRAPWPVAPEQRSEPRRDLA